MAACLLPVLAVGEQRLKAAVLVGVGLPFDRGLLPESDPFNFVPRFQVPTLMVSGRSDFIFPLETSQRPMFRLLGAPEKDKRLVLQEGGHARPQLSDGDQGSARLVRPVSRAGEVAQYGHGGGTKALSNPSASGNAEASGRLPGIEPAFHGGESGEQLLGRERVVTKHRSHRPAPGSPDRPESSTVFGRRFRGGRPQLSPGLCAGASRLRQRSPDIAKARRRNRGRWRLRQCSSARSSSPADHPPARPARRGTSFRPEVSE